MERRKFVKYAGLAGIAAGLFPAAGLKAMSSNSSSHLIKFAGVSTQIRHGALNIPFASRLLDEMPFRWVLDVHQNIFLKDGFQRNVDEDMNVISVALKEEEHFEALQISKQADRIKILWKDQWLDCKINSPLRPLEIEDKSYDFQLGYIAKGETLDFEQKPNVDYFVQVIEGEMQNEDNILDSESGLGLMSDTTVRQKLEARAASCILVIARET